MASADGVGKTETAVGAWVMRAGVRLQGPRGTLWRRLAQERQGSPSSGQEASGKTQALAPSQVPPCPRGPLLQNQGAWVLPAGSMVSGLVAVLWGHQGPGWGLTLLLP